MQKRRLNPLQSKIYKLQKLDFLL